MGLLGDSWDDPKTAATLQLAAGLLGPGGFGTGLSRGLLGYQGSLASAAETKLKNAGAANVAQEALLRDLQMQQMRQKLDFGAQFMNPQAAAPQGMSPASQAMGMGAQQGSVGPTVQNAQTMNAMPQQGSSRFASLTPDQVAGALAAGLISKDTADLWTHLNNGMPMQPGWNLVPGQAPRYLPDPTKGITVDKNGNPTLMPNAANVLGAVAGATKEGELRGQNRQTLIPIDRLDRMPGVSPTASLDDLLNPAPGVAGAAPNRAMATNITADMRQNGAPGGTVNGTPVGQPLFKTPAQMEADKLRATQDVHLETDPLIDLRREIPVKAHAANQASLSSLADITNNEGEIVARNNRIKPLLDQLPNIGGFAADARMDFANKLKNSGVLPQATLDSLSTKLAGGDANAAKVVANQLSAAAIQTMLDTLNKEGKPNRVMYQALKEQQEGLAAGKDVLASVMDLQEKLYKQHQSQLGSMTDLMSAPDYNPVKFQSQFATAKSDAISASPLPPNPTSSSLTVGKIYQLPNGKTAKWDGFKFKAE